MKNKKNEKNDILKIINLLWFTLLELNQAYVAKFNGRN